MHQLRPFLGRPLHQFIRQLVHARARTQQSVPARVVQPLEKSETCGAVERLWLFLKSGKRGLQSVDDLAILSDGSRAGFPQLNRFLVKQRLVLLNRTVGLRQQQLDFSIGWERCCILSMAERRTTKHQQDDDKNVSNQHSCNPFYCSLEKSRTVGPLTFEVLLAGL
jgi:hypothetical protein